MSEQSPEGVVTVMFTDIVSSTDLVTERGDKAARGLFEQHEDLIRGQLEEHSGREVETTGDGFLVTFTSTRQAVACAVDIQRALSERNRRYPDDEINVRVGLNTGEVIQGEDRVFGAAVSAAARVAERATGGEILATETTKQLAGTLPGISFVDRGQLALKGFPQHWRVFEVAWSQAETNIPIMLVDDHPLWRETLRKVLEHKGVGKVIAEASDGEEALAVAPRVAAEVMIMDIDLPSISGIETTRRLIAQRPDLKVLVLSGSSERSDVVDAVEAGASGYLLKTAGSAEIADAVRRIHAGELVFPAAIADIVLEEFRRRGHPKATAREKDEPVATPVVENVFVREGEFWTLAFGGEVIRMKDSKGLHDIALLLARPSQEVLASDVYAAREGTLHPGDLGDAGELLDHEAKAAYKNRLEELRAELEHAEEWSDTERASKAKEEMDYLGRELAAAVGLGGRDRKAASGSERARISVTKAIRAALDRIERSHPALGRHLARSLKTGTFCSYSPDEVVSWRL